MKTTYQTNRLTLQKLNPSHAIFIMELLNTPEWIKFIGDRHINSVEASEAYIKKISSDPKLNYWVVTCVEIDKPVGIVTLIKRDYLDYNDIGFALLGRFAGNGYAYEAAQVVLEDALQSEEYSKVLAITMTENTSSIKLLTKLGFAFLNEIQHEGELLNVFHVKLNEELNDFGE